MKTATLDWNKKGQDVKPLDLAEGEEGEFQFTAPDTLTDSAKKNGSFFVDTRAGSNGSLEMTFQGVKKTIRTGHGSDHWAFKDTPPQPGPNVVSVKAVGGPMNINGKLFSGAKHKG